MHELQKLTNDLPPPIIKLTTTYEIKKHIKMNLTLKTPNNFDFQKHITLDPIFKRLIYALRAQSKPKITKEKQNRKENNEENQLQKRREQRKEGRESLDGSPQLRDQSNRDPLKKASN